MKNKNKIWILILCMIFLYACSGDTKEITTTVVTTTTTTTLNDINGVGEALSEVGTTEEELEITEIDSMSENLENLDWLL